MATNVDQDLAAIIKADAVKIKTLINTYENYGSALVHEDVTKLLNHLTMRAHKFTEWEDDFMDSIVFQFNRGFTMSKKQIDVMIKIFKRLEAEV